MFEVDVVLRDGGRVSRLLIEGDHANRQGQSQKNFQEGLN